jgi:thiol-disulfide isomerase/thioredoxin
VRHEADAPPDASPSGGRAVLLVVLVAVVGTLAWQAYGPRPVARARVLEGPVGVSDPCDGKAACVVAVVAPWCGACRAAQPFIERTAAVAQRMPGTGFRVVVTGAARPELVGYAAHYQQVPAFVDDDDNAFLGSTGVDSFPSFLVLDKKGRVVRRTAGALGGDVDDDTIRAWLERELNVGS